MAQSWTTRRGVQQSADELPVEPPLDPIELLPPLLPEPEEPMVLEPPEPLEDPIVEEPVLLPPEEPVEPAEADGLVLLLLPEPEEPPEEADGLLLPDDPMELLPVPPLAVLPRFAQGLVLLDELPLPEAPMPLVDEPELPEPMLLPEPLEPELEGMLLDPELEGVLVELDGELVEPVLPPLEPPEDDWACTAAEATARAALALRRANLRVVKVMWMVLRSWMGNDGFRPVPPASQVEHKRAEQWGSSARGVAFLRVVRGGGNARARAGMTARAAGLGSALCLYDWPRRCFACLLRSMAAAVMPTSGRRADSTSGMDSPADQR